MAHDEAFGLEQGILVPARRPHHREDEYDERGFNVLLQMQRNHFWYRGRHKLLWRVLEKELRRNFADARGLRAIDLGGGCGGWLDYLHSRAGAAFDELALGDSSMRALSLAEPVVASFGTRYQVDLLDLPWSEDWDVVFLLDVIEHIPDHEEVLRQVRKSMRPGGLLFVTTPALNFFWTYNDSLAHHQRRYSRDDYRVLGERTGFDLLRADYFMFFLSPVLLLSRLLVRPRKTATPEELREHLEKTHRIPPPPINAALTHIFSLEAAVVNAIPFPWGTSILAVFKR